MANKADENKANNVAVKDEIGMECFEAQVEALNKEIELFESNIERHKIGMERFQKQWDRDNELWQIKIDGYKKKPEHRTFEYEDDPRFWELMKGVIDDQYYQDKFTTESKIKSDEMKLHDMETELQGCIKKLLELESEE